MNSRTMWDGTMAFGVVRRLLWIWLTLVFSLAGFADGGSAPDPGHAERGQSVTIARDGKAILPITLSPDAPEKVEILAQELADHLQRITGAAFSVERGSELRGIVVGTAEEWPGHLPPPAQEKSPLLAREDYLLQTGPERLLLIGRTPLAVQHAVWDFLYRLGFRQYFPGPVWEIWPEHPKLEVRLDVVESPAYSTRRIGINIWPENREAYAQWRVRNRMVSGFTLNTGHSYGEIIRKNRDHFDAHPEDIVGKIRPNAKFDPSQPTLLDFIARYAQSEFERQPSLDSLSADPSDGGGWRADSPLGSPSNQALTVANRMARAIAERHPGRKIGMYAYHEHSPPPDIKVEPNIIISVATAFLLKGHTPEYLMKVWQEKGAEIGVREYLSVWAWANDMPGRARASNLAYICQSIPRFHELGARYWISEASSGWGANGLGNYLAARVLWDLKEATRQEAILDDFFQRSFGPVAPEMRTFYGYLLADKRPLVSGDLIGRMYRTLQAALDKSDSPRITARILSLAIYARFVELMYLYRNAPGGEWQARYEELAHFAYRGRFSHMVEGRGIFEDIPRRDQRIEAPGWGIPESRDPRKVPGLVSEKELREFISRGIAEWELCGFEPVSYSKDLVPYWQAEGWEGARGPSPIVQRGRNRFYLYALPGQTEFEFQVEGGGIYRNRGPVKLRLFSDQHVMVDEPVAEIEVPPDRTKHDVILKTPYPGLHLLEVDDGGDQTKIGWPPGQSGSVPVAAEESGSNVILRETVFYVPPGVTTIGGYAKKAGGIISLPDGTPLFNLRSVKQPGFFSFELPENEHGTILHLLKGGGAFMLLTTPPYLARTPSELLIPKEVSPPVQ